MPEAQVQTLLNSYSSYPRTHEWTFNFRLPDALKKALTSLGSDVSILDHIDLLAETHRLPGVTLETIIEYYKGSPYAIPQRSNRSGEITIPFKEIVDTNKRYGVYKLFSDWANLCDSAELGVGLPIASVKGEMVVSLWQKLNNEVEQPSAPLFKILYKFVWCRQVEDTPLGNDPTAIVKPPVHFLYDLWKYEK